MPVGALDATQVRRRSIHAASAVVAISCQQAGDLAAGRAL